MGLFSKPDPQKFFDTKTFTVTRTLFDPPRITLLPAIYLDEPRKKWAVKFRGTTPGIFAYADIAQCEVVEAGDSKEASEVSNVDFASEIITNPARATRLNAAKRDMCLGLGVVVLVNTPEAENPISKLEIPLFSGEVKRDSKAYQSLRESAETIKAEFDKMKTEA